MNAPGVVVFLIVFILGAISTVLGFIAETQRIKISDISVSNGLCTYTSTPALPLALIAAAALLISEIIVAVYTRCVCCKRGNSDYKPCALVCSIISWIAAGIGIILFLSGAGLHAQREEEPRDVQLRGVYYCSYKKMKPGIFAGAAGLALISTLLGLVAISIIDSIDDRAQNAAVPTGQVPVAYYDHQQQGHGIAMTQPQTLSNTAVYKKDVRGGELSAV